MKIAILILAVAFINTATAQNPAPSSAPNFKTEQMKDGTIRFSAGDDYYDVTYLPAADVIDRLESHLVEPSDRFLKILAAAKQKLRGQPVTLDKDLVGDVQATLKGAEKHARAAAADENLEIAKRAIAHQDAWAFHQALEAFVGKKTSGSGGTTVRTSKSGGSKSSSGSGAVVPTGNAG